MITVSNPFLKLRQTFVLTSHVHPFIVLMFVDFIYKASASNQAFKDLILVLQNPTNEWTGI